MQEKAEKLVGWITKFKEVGILQCSMIQFMQHYHGREIDADILIQFCGGLLLLDEQLCMIRFSHLSVQEYLETESMNKHWDIIDAQHLIMEACLWILQCRLPPESVPLYHYATCYWFRHCRSYQDLVEAAASNKPSNHTLDVDALGFLVCRILNLLQI